MQDLIAAGSTISATILRPQSSDRRKTVRAIAILSMNRSQALPNLATAHEQGLKDFEADNWPGVLPAQGDPGGNHPKLHDAASQRWHPAIQHRLTEPAPTAVAPDRQSPEYLKNSWRARSRNGRAAIKAAGVSAN